MTIKLFCASLAFLICGLTGRTQTPGYVQTIGKTPIRLDTADGRKLLIVILPAQPDTALNGQLIRFQARHSLQVRIFGIVPPGYGAVSGTPPQQAFANFSAAGLILTEGLGDTDSVTGTRSGILKYLSQKSRNRQVDHFAEGSKYFLSENGRMFAQLDKDGSLDSRTADHIIQTIVP